MNKVNYEQNFACNAPIKTCNKNETTGSIGFKNADNTDQGEFISSEVSSAARAYGLSYINQNKIKP